MKDYRLNQKLLEFLTSKKGRLAAKQILDGDTEAIDAVARSFFDTFGVSQKETQAARDTVIRMAKRVDINGTMQDTEQKGFNTKASKKKIDITTDNGNAIYRNKVNALKKLLMRDPKLMIASAVERGLSDAVLRPIAKKQTNDANKLAEAILAASRGGVTDRGRDLFGTSPKEVGANIAALNKVRKGENKAAFINGLANAMDSIMTDVRSDDDYARQLATMHTLAESDGSVPTSGMYNMLNGNARRAQQREKWSREGK